MRSLSFLLVALVATVELCKGAALEKVDKPLPEQSDLCKGQTPSLCGKQKREVVQESKEQPVPRVNCQLTPSLCGEKKPEVESEKIETPAAIPPVGCTGTASECERKKREVKPVEFSPPLSNPACRSLCGGARG